MKPTFQWNDAFLLNEQLTDEERAVVDAANTFCQERLQWPRATKNLTARS